MIAVVVCFVSTTKGHCQIFRSFGWNAAGDCREPAGAAKNRCQHLAQIGLCERSDVARRECCQTCQNRQRGEKCAK